MLSRTTEYAIRAMIFVQLQNWDNKTPGIVEIAAEIDAPEAYTAKILQTLTRHRILGSMKGRRGGFFIIEDVHKITFYDVIHVMEGDSIFTRCGFGLKNCNEINPCPLHDKYVEVRQAFYNIAKTETIQSLSLRIKKGQAVLKSK